MIKRIHKTPSYILSVLIVLSSLMYQQAESQQIQDRLQDLFTPGIYGSNVANYYFAQPGDFTILVSVWGEVGRSGRYEVPVGTNIGDLLSLAGGPGADQRGVPGADAWSRRYSGKTVVRISRLIHGAGRDIIFENRIEDLLRLREYDVPLQEGDIIMIDRISKINIWDVFSLVSTSATLVLLLDRIFGFFGD